MNKRVYTLFGVFVLVVSTLMVWGLFDEIRAERDWIRDNTGHRWEVRHVGGQEYLYSRGRLVFLRPCACGRIKQDSL